MTDTRSNWKEISLGELGKWITGSTPKSSNPLNFGNDVDFVTPSDIGYGGLLGPSERKISHLGASSVRKVKAPSVNLVCIGTIGKVALARRDVTTNQQINSLEVDKSVIDPNFVMWLLSSPEIQEKLWESASSTTVAILNKGNLEKIKTHIPSLPEQQKIVDILEDHLSRLDSALAEVKQAKLKAAQFRRSLLQAAFTGNLTGDGTRLITSWRCVSLATILEPRKTKDIPAKFPDLPYIGMEHVAKEIGTIEALGVSAEYRSNAPKVEKGDVLYGRLRPYLNKVVIAPFEAFASGEFIVLPENEAIGSKFLQYRLLSQDFVDFAGTLDTGDRPRVSWDQISKFQIDLPPLSEQQKIVELLEDHLSRLDASVAIADAMEKQSASLRRSLVQAAFTGQLTKEVASV